MGLQREIPDTQACAEIDSELLVPVAQFGEGWTALDGVRASDITRNDKAGAALYWSVLNQKKKGERQSTPGRISVDWQESK